MANFYSQLHAQLLGAIIMILVLVLGRIMFICWILPARFRSKLRAGGFKGPNPMFPLGNIGEMKKSDSDLAVVDGSSNAKEIHHDIHAVVFPYFARWQRLHGKVFVYWLGTEPFLYIADPDFLKEVAGGTMGKSWGKPRVFKKDREPMFGNGLLMTEGDEWVHRRHIITPAFSPSSLKDMVVLMVESTRKTISRWSAQMDDGKLEIDVEKEFTTLAGEIIARSSFGVSPQDCKRVLEKLRALQLTLFNSNRFVGVPYSKLLYRQKTMEAKRLGKEIDALLMSIIKDRLKTSSLNTQQDLLGLLLEENHGELDGRKHKKLTTRELVDECKTFFFGGHETTALALTWTLLLLAMYPEWQNQLREEIELVVGDKDLDLTMLTELKKMGWVMNEVLRLYSPAPNVQRQTRKDIRAGDTVIPCGTNMWIDVVSMNHDPDLWGDHVNEFRPERFSDNVYGGCRHRMGFLPFGFGGRMCIGRNLSMMEYKVVLSMIIPRFSFSVSPNYHHSPLIMLSLRPGCGLPLIVEPLY